PASAQATRTWVSGVGDDVNPCSRTAPCKTFAGAISKTAAGGEINCLDPGGFGTLTIIKSITVDCSGTFGSALNSGGINGFVINDSATATPGTIEVTLRGLSINGAGVTPGLNGVRFISGKSLTLENIIIQNQKSGSGIALTPTRGMTFNAQNVTVARGNNGILIQPTGSGTVRGALNNVRVGANSASGLRVDTTGLTTGFGVRLAVDNSVFSNNNDGIVVVAPSGSVPVVMMVKDVLSSSNPGNGISATGTNAHILVGSSAITDNGTGVASVSGGNLNSYVTNQVNGNGSDGAFTANFAPR
ncbi:MAG TPA: hypothetical protein VNA29_07260, partial [Sphingomicrobium sp.]|nr:hypothetical protein [Sphingomicrobium sp.]